MIGTLDTSTDLYLVALTETLDTILTTSGTYRDYGYLYLPLMTTTVTLDTLLTSSCIYRDSGYFN